MIVVTLAHAADAQGWRERARALLAHGCPPHEVQWRVAGEPTTAPLAGLGGREDDLPAAAATASVPAGFVVLSRVALLHRDASRHALLYRLLWRLVHESGLRHDPLDADRLAAAAMAQQVRRDIHKMKAFVRFAERDDGSLSAWFEPQHHVVEAVAPFFARRYANLRWALFTPLRSVSWDGAALHFGAGARRADVIEADAQSALWLTYYRSIFNPARLKLDSMRQHMPRRYWHNLPEAQLIAPLTAEAQRRTDAMIDRGGTEPQRRRPALPPVRVDGTPREAAMHCLACPHAAHATQTVWGEGPPAARLMLVGEQPGDEEDLRGRPFAGPAGRLLDRALAEIGLPRETVYLTNAVKHFRFELRGRRRLHKTPGQREVLACAGWLQAEIDTVQPVALAALGATAARALLGDLAIPLADLRGRWRARADGRAVLVTWHPAALLRMAPPERAAAWPVWLAHLRQLLAVRNGLQAIDPPADSAGALPAPQ